LFGYAKKKTVGDTAHLRTSCAAYDVVLLKMETHMRLSGNSVGTQKPYLRAVRDLMEGCQSIPELLSADAIKAHLVSFRGILSSSALNLRVCGIKYYFRYVVHRPDLAVDIPNPRVAKYVQDVLSEAEILLLLSDLKYCSIPLTDTATPLSVMLAREVAAKLASEAKQLADLASKSKDAGSDSPKS
jgi:hypothetical protein